MRREIRRAVLLACATILIPIAGTGQTLPFDHIHISVPHTDEAVDWYRELLGGEPVPNEPGNRLFVGETRLNFLEAADPFPTRDRVIDHVGFAVQDPSATAQDILGSGGTRDPVPSHLPGGVALRDPWGTRIELTPGGTGQIDHVQLRAPEPEETLEWIRQMFGGERTQLNGQAALRFGEIVVAVAGGDTKGSEGAAFDHIGWRPPDIDQTVAKLRENGVHFLSDVEPRGPIVKIVFLEGPSGLKIELVQR